MFNSPIPLEDHKRRLIFRAWHRGIKELDLIFGNYVEKNIERMSHEDIIWFDALFEENDHEILAWVTKDKETPAEYDTPWMDELKKLDFLTLRAR